MLKGQRELVMLSQSRKENTTPGQDPAEPRPWSRKEVRRGTGWSQAGWKEEACSVLHVVNLSEGKYDEQHSLKKYYRVLKWEVSSKPPRRTRFRFQREVTGQMQCFKRTGPPGKQETCYRH